MNLWHDLRYGARMLRKSPGFTAIAVVTMALGIGATTAIFSVADAMLWKPVPLPHLESLVMVLQRVPGESNAWDEVPPADLEDIRAQNTGLQNLASWEWGLANIVGAGGEPERVQQVLVTANFFEVLGVQPARGRAFAPGEDQPGRERVVILSDGLWRRRFGGDPGIVGTPIRLDDRDYLVAGVMPRKFAFPPATEVWTPIALTPEQRHSRRGGMLASMGHLAPGRGVEQVAAELDAVAARLEKLYPDTNKDRRYMAVPAHRFLIGEYNRQYVLLLFGAVLFVLLIACVNVANLQFARATGRLREVAVRTALGAGRGRVIGQLVTESVLLSLAGAVLGLLIANWGLNMIRAGMPPEVEKYIVGWSEIHLDGRTMGFTLAAAMLSGLLAGLAPAWQCSRPNLTESLKEGGRGSSAGRGRHRLRAVLVAGEIALAVVLLVGAGLMGRGFRAILGGADSFEPATLLSLRLAITDNKYREPHQVAAFYREVVERTAALPGVRSAVAVTAMPYSGHSNSRGFEIEGRQLERGKQPWAQYQAITPNYFRTMHIPLHAGRFLREGDGDSAPFVAVISERAARRWWPGEPWPIGKRIRIGPREEKGPWITIVGVVGDVMHDVYDRAPRAVMYLPFAQAPSRWMDIGIRTAGDPLRVAPAATAAIRSVDPEQPISEVASLETLRHRQATGLAYVAWLMGVFGALALALSSIGVYGVMAYMVTEQTHEIGIRMALGSPRGNVLKMVFRRGMLTTAAGLVTGLGVAYGFARLLASLIFGVTASDPATFLGIPLALVIAASLAIYIPARRAMKIDPIMALRYE